MFRGWSHSCRISRDQFQSWEFNSFELDETFLDLTMQMLLLWRSHLLKRLLECLSWWVSLTIFKSLQYMLIRCGLRIKHPAFVHLNFSHRQWEGNTVIRSSKNLLFRKYFSYYRWRMMLYILGCCRSSSLNSTRLYGNLVVILFQHYLSHVFIESFLWLD